MASFYAVNKEVLPLKVYLYPLASRRELACSFSFSICFLLIKWFVAV